MRLLSAWTFPVGCESNLGEYFARNIVEEFDPTVRIIFLFRFSVEGCRDKGVCS